MKRGRNSFENAFSLVEVVLALGVISFAVVAILGVFPVGLSTGHSAQDETRAPQIAQMILSSLSSQVLKRDATGQPLLDGSGQTQLNDAAKIQCQSNQTVPVDLGTSATPTTPNLYADNNGQLMTVTTNATYSVTVITDNTPVGFDSGYANKVTVVVAWPANAAAANQTKRDYMRIVSKY
jgi:type II secretory pathway pseudopilin PulG